MFYVKENINDAMEVTVEINDENVFCHCPRCGAEVPVDLNEFFGDAEFDLFGTAICCTECSRKMRCEKSCENPCGGRERCRKDGQRIRKGDRTTDGQSVCAHAYGYSE